MVQVNANEMETNEKYYPPDTLPKIVECQMIYQLYNLKALIWAIEYK